MDDVFCREGESLDFNGVPKLDVLGVLILDDIDVGGAVYLFLWYRNISGFLSMSSVSATVFCLPAADKVKSSGEAEEAVASVLAAIRAEAALCLAIIGSLGMGKRNRGAVLSVIP